MILKLKNYTQLANAVKERNSNIIIYGAGMIGQTILPYMISKYELWQNVDCFIDADLRKQGKAIMIGEYSYDVKAPDYLRRCQENSVILITNSKFFPIVSFLDGINELDGVEGYIIPMMQICDLEKMPSAEIKRNTETSIIPRVIHYCWFGGNRMPDYLVQCIDSWKRICPEYEIRRWDENNFDVGKHRFTKQAYEQRKYGFVTDLARLDILYEHGGIYLDTDVTIIQKPDSLLCQNAFVGVEKWGNINTGGGCGFISGHPMLKEMIDYRSKFDFVLSDGTLNLETNGFYETSLFMQHGFKPDQSLQVINDVTVYPSYVMHPYDYMSCNLQKREDTHFIHHFYGGWMEENDRLNRMNTQNAYLSILRRIESGGKPV